MFRQFGMQSCGQRYSKFWAFLLKTNTFRSHHNWSVVDELLAYSLRVNVWPLSPLFDLWWTEIHQNSDSKVRYELFVFQLCCLCSSGSVNYNCHQKLFICFFTRNHQFCFVITQQKRTQHGQSNHMRNIGIRSLGAVYVGIGGESEITTSRSSTPA